VAGRFVSLVMDGLVGVDPSAKLVVVVLADCANQNAGGIAFPSIATIARRTGICERQVRDHLRKLEVEDWISREGATHGGRGMTTRYRLNLRRLLTVAALEKAAAERRVSEKKGGSASPGINGENPAVQPTKPGSVEHETRQFTAINPAAHRPRTGSEPFRTGIEPGAHAKSETLDTEGTKRKADISIVIPEPEKALKVVASKPTMNDQQLEQRRQLLLRQAGIK
jgi:hypothetical protein